MYFGWGGCLGGDVELKLPAIFGRGGIEKSNTASDR